MRTAYTLDRPTPRTPGEVARWVETAGWLLAFALILAAPCAPEPPRPGAARADRPPAPISAPRGGAPRPP